MCSGFLMLLLFQPIEMNILKMRESTLITEYLLFIVHWNHGMCLGFLMILLFEPVDLVPVQLEIMMGLGDQGINMLI
jgi:hypothetical protein